MHQIQNCIVFAFFGNLHFLAKKNWKSPEGYASHESSIDNTGLNKIMSGPIEAMDPSQWADDVTDSMTTTWTKSAVRSSTSPWCPSVLSRLFLKYHLRLEVERWCYRKLDGFPVWKKSWKMSMLANFSYKVLVASSQWHADWIFCTISCLKKFWSRNKVIGWVLKNRQILEILGKYPYIWHFFQFRNFPCF